MSGGRPENKRKRNIIPMEMDDGLLQQVAAVSEEVGESKATVMRLSIRAGLEEVRQALLKLGKDKPPAHYGAHQPQHLLLNETEKPRKPKP